jgi:hypothetical protein
MATNYDFIKKVLDNFDKITQDLTSISAGDFIIDSTTSKDAATNTKFFNTIQHIISNFYLVFHFPEKVNPANPTEDTEFDANQQDKPKIQTTDRVMNYIFTSTAAAKLNHKILLSNTGINESTFIELKMILDKLNAVWNKEADFLRILEEETVPKTLHENFDKSTTNNTFTRGGGKKGGMSKSNKRIKKIKKKNKSSKSQR